MRIGLVLALVVVTVVGLAAYAVGASKSAQDVVLCAAGKSGDLSLASGKGKCDKGEKKLTIAKQGPAGPVGPQGTAGAPGVDATAKLEGVHYVTGPATDTCFEGGARFCRNSGSSIGWENFGTLAGTDLEKVGFYKDSAGIVHLVGVANYGSSGGGSGGFEAEGPFYLPAGYRPANGESFNVRYGESLGESTQVLVRPDGAVLAPASTNRGVSLSGISFRAAGS